MTNAVLIDIQEHIAIVTLNRPEKLNALNMAMFEGLIDAGEQLAQLKDVRAIVLCGNGNSFCSGLDVSAMMGGEFMGKAFAVTDRSPANFAQRAAVIWQEVPQPVIGAVQGKCFGGGLQIIMGADIRYGAPDVDLRVLEIKWGMMPDMGYSQTMLNTLKIDVAKELMWTGRSVGAAEAMQLGLLTHLDDDPLSGAVALANDIAERSPDAVQAGKQLLNQAWRTQLKEGYQLEARLQLELLGQPNQVEAVMSNVEKRKAKYR